MAELRPEAAKAGLRRKAHEARAALSVEHRAAFAKEAAAHFLDMIAVAPDDMVAGYWPIRDEFDCRPLLDALRARGLRVALPVVSGPDAPLQFRHWQPQDELVPAGFGTFAPPVTAVVVVPDLILVPLLAFDADGTRLGYGGGYYDRTLASLAQRPRLIGMAFDAQELDRIPREGHDVALDAVITESGVRWFGI